MSESYKEARAKWVEANPIRAWRAKHGISQGDLAVLIGGGCSAFAVSSYETGRFQPGEARLERLKQILGRPHLERMLKRWREGFPSPEEKR